MTTTANFVMFPTLTIESVHGFKETIVLGPNGIEPHKPCSGDTAGAASKDAQSERADQSKR